MVNQEPRWSRATLNRCFAALADPMRRELIEILVRQPGLTVGDVTGRFKVSRFTVMRHLNVLEEADLLYRERSGTSKNLYINRSKLAELHGGWLGSVVEGLE